MRRFEQKSTRPGLPLESPSMVRPPLLPRPRPEWGLPMTTTLGWEPALGSSFGPPGPWHSALHPLLLDRRAPTPPSDPWLKITLPRLQPPLLLLLLPLTLRPHPQAIPLLEEEEQQPHPARTPPECWSRFSNKCPPRNESAARWIFWTTRTTT